MAGLTLARVAPVSGAVATISDGGAHPQRRNPRGRKPRSLARSRLLAAILPGIDQEQCEISCDLSETGALLGLVVTDRGSGRVLRRLTVEQMAHLSASSDQRGLFFERRG